MKYSDEVQEELNKLVKFGDVMGFYVVMTNQGRSVKVIKRNRIAAGNCGYALYKLVSLYNLGMQSPYARTLDKWQKYLLDGLDHKPAREPIRLQRCRGGLKIQG